MPGACKMEMQTLPSGKTKLGGWLESSKVGSKFSEEMVKEIKYSLLLGWNISVLNLISGGFIGKSGGKVNSALK